MPSDGYVLGKIPYGRHHDSMLGRILYVYARIVHGMAFAAFIFAVMYWDNWAAIDSRLHFLVFLALSMMGMRGSVYQQDRRTLEYVRDRLGESDV